MLSVRGGGDDDCLPQDIVSGRVEVVARCLQVVADALLIYGLRFEMATLGTRESSLYLLLIVRSHLCVAIILYNLAF